MPLVKYVLKNAIEITDLTNLLQRQETVTHDTIAEVVEEVITVPKRAGVLLYESCVYGLPKWQSCQLIYPWKSLYPNQLSYGFRKNSPFKPFFNYRLLTYIETGFIHDIYKKYNADFFSCPEEDENISNSLSGNKLISLFMILGIGYLASLVLALGENLASKIDTRSKQDKEVPIQGIQLRSNYLEMKSFYMNQTEF